MAQGLQGPSQQRHCFNSKLLERLKPGMAGSDVTLGKPFWLLSWDEAGEG